MPANLLTIIDSIQFMVFGPNTTVSPWTQEDDMYKGTFLYASDPGFFFNGVSQIQYASSDN